MIRVSHVNKRLGQTKVLEDVSIDIPARGVTSLIGPNGAGKSTLLSIIARQLGQSAGTVELEGRDMRFYGSGDFATRLAFLQQNNELNVRLTVLDLVNFGRFPYSGGSLSEMDHKIVDSVMQSVGLSDLKERFLDQLSGGQRQRAFIAMILAQDTKYTLFDEPLNNLDIAHAVTTMRILRKAASDLGRSVIVVLHDLNFAARYSDQVVALSEGKVIATGTPADVFQAQTLKSLYGLDIGVAGMGDRLHLDVYG